MSALSSQAVGVVADFAASLGLSAPQPARDGSFSFVFAQSGLLTFTPAAETGRVILSLALTPLRLDEASERRVLNAAGLDATAGRIIHTGVAPDGSVLVMLDVDDEELNLPTIETCFRALVDRHAAIG